MKSLLGNFSLALLVFAGILWFFISREQQLVDTMADRYGAGSASAAAAPASAGPSISIDPTGSK